MTEHQENKVNLAIFLAKVGHHGQLDKGGNDYFEHLSRVAMNTLEHADLYQDTISVTNCVIVAYLHDYLEDVSNDNERDANMFATLFGEEVATALVILTKCAGESRSAYIDRVLGNRIACLVKYHDLLDNMDLTRLNTVTDKDMRRNQNYIRDLARVEDRLRVYGLS